MSLGKVGTAPIGTGPAPGFYTGNALLRVAFNGANAVTYYVCKERFDNGGVRACVPVGTGTYTIATLGDARVMTLTSPPVQAAPLNYNRVFVERGGLVYFGYQNKPLVTNAARLNTTATTALLAQLAVTAEDPSVPLALTAGSYQGTWDLRDSMGAVSPTAGSTVFINANGNVSCQDRATSARTTTRPENRWMAASWEGGVEVALTLARGPPMAGLFTGAGEFVSSLSLCGLRLPADACPAP